MLVANDCNTGTLAPYVPSSDQPWDLRRIQHLMRRVGFSDNVGNLKLGLNFSPSGLVDQLIDQALAMPLSAEPSWANDTYGDSIEQNEIDANINNTIEWSVEMMSDLLTNGLRDKMVLFWSNHFVTRAEDYLCSSYMYAYHKILQSNCLGDFKTFTKEIGRSSAMLVFLNGVQNTRIQPNENYARELLELFTLGRDNGYTQNDIVEAARALTGYNGFDQNNLCAPIDYFPILHDNGSKTIFGQTGNYDFDGLHELLFAERSTELSQYICRKLYIEFVSPDVSDNIVEGMAETFRNNDFNIASVLRQLLKSEHFFDDTTFGNKFKSPIETYLQLLKELDFPYTINEAQLIYLASSDQGQQLLNPPNVAGWPGNRDWIDTTALPARWEIYDAFILNLFTENGELLRSLAKDLTDNSDDVEFVSRAIVNFLIPVGLQNAKMYEEALEVFKADLPENYFQDGTWNLDYNPDPNIDIVVAQVALLIRHCVRLPEFQLF